MGTEESKTLSRRWIDEVVNQHDLARRETLASPDCVMHFAGSPEPIRGFAAMKEMGATYFTAFPDMRVALEHELAEGDMAAHTYTWTGTHQGELQGIPATAKRVMVAGADVFRCRDGKIVEHRAFDDILGLMQQLGAIPQPQEMGA